MAKDIQSLAEKVEGEWDEVLRILDISPKALPHHIQLYFYATPEEMLAGIMARQGEERTYPAVADFLVGTTLRGKLGLFAASLLFGPPGNRVLPRGLVLWLDDPDHPWAEEAWTWSDRLSLLARDFRRIERLLPKDPWEEVFFQIDAPWVSAVLTLEKMRTFMDALHQGKRGGNRLSEVYSAALVRWIVENFGTNGVRAFWQAKSWEEAASSLGEDPVKLKEKMLAFLEEAFSSYPSKDFLLAIRKLYSGQAQQAKELVGGSEGPRAKEIRFLAALALGEIEEALVFCDQPIPELEALRNSPILRAGPLVIVGDFPQRETWVQRAQVVLGRASLIWPEIFEVLPDQLAIYVGQPPNIPIPWGVIWTEDYHRMPEAVARFTVEAVSPWGLPDFSTLTEGVVLWLVYPERDFREEARKILEEERWASLTQTLFGVYPADIAEAEAGGFVCFLLERYGAEKLRLLWENLAEGASIFRAAEIVFGLSFPLLENQLKQWAKQL